MALKKAPGISAAQTAIAGTLGGKRAMASGGSSLQAPMQRKTAPVRPVVAARKAAVDVRFAPPSAKSAPFAAKKAMQNVARPVPVASGLVEKMPQVISAPSAGQSWFEGAKQGSAAADLAAQRGMMQQQAIPQVAPRPMAVQGGPMGDPSATMRAAQAAAQAFQRPQPAVQPGMRVGFDRASGPDTAAMAARFAAQAAPAFQNDQMRAAVMPQRQFDGPPAGAQFAQRAQGFQPQSPIAERQFAFAGGLNSAPSAVQRAVPGLMGAPMGDATLFGRPQGIDPNEANRQQALIRALRGY